MSTSQNRRLKRMMERVKANSKTKSQMSYDEWLSQVVITPEMLKEMEEFQKAEDSKPKIINAKTNNKNNGFSFEEVNF